MNKTKPPAKPGNIQIPSIDQPTDSGRRKALLAGLGAAGGAAAAGLMTPSRALADPANLPPNVADWSKVLGPGVDVAPYGMPSKFEKTVIRRYVDWLTATPESSINFTPLYALDGMVTPNGLCFERHHGGVAEVIPDDYRLMIHGMVDRPLVFTYQDLK
ncbi:MAG TPA: sulfite dehydrogenase, partial [Rhodospirillaceae bacterium]|nr:sulfite dehydrogenase [Rhodospirillaceae bacterium]